jgi:hypothetical protein
MSALFSVLARLLFLIAAAIFLTSLLVAGVLLAAVWLVWNLLRGAASGVADTASLPGPLVRPSGLGQGPILGPPGCSKPSRGKCGGCGSA